METAIGFATHSGWAVAINCGLDETGHLGVVDRRRVELVDDDLPRQAYHAVVGVTPREADAVVDRVDASIFARAQQALAEIAATSQDVTVVGVAIVGGPRDIPDVATVLASHALMHACEGEQYRRGIVDAADGVGLHTVRIAPAELAARVSATIGWTPARIERELAAVRARIGPPWQKDHKTAALAALTALRQ